MLLQKAKNHKENKNNNKTKGGMKNSNMSKCYKIKEKLYTEGFVL